MSVEKENINKEQITEDLKNQIMDDLKRYENELYINGMGINALTLDAKVTALLNVLIANNIVTENNFNLIHSLTMETKVYKESLEAFRAEAIEIKRRMDECSKLLEN